MENYWTSIFEHIRDFSFLGEAISEKTSRSDVELFSIKKIKQDRRFLNTVDMDFVMIKWGTLEIFNIVS